MHQERPGERVRCTGTADERARPGSQPAGHARRERRGAATRGRSLTRQPRAATCPSAGRESRPLDCLPRQGNFRGRGAVARRSHAGSRVRGSAIGDPRSQPSVWRVDPAPPARSRDHPARAPGCGYHPARVFAWPDSSFVWVVDREGLKSYRLAPRAEIEHATREAYDLVTARAVLPTAEPAQERARRIAEADAALPGALRRLTDLVLTPIGVLPNTPRLVVVADGALQYLPFEMLPVPRSSGERERPMIVDFEIVTLPSASTLSVQRARTAGRQRPLLGVAVFADPVFDVSDPRVRGKRTASISDDAQARVLVHTSEPTAANSARIARLPFTDEEAKAILATAAGEKNLAAIGFAATKASVVDSALSAYRYVHFATHGFLDTERPSLSAIALSLVDAAGNQREGFLRAHELYNLDLSADLVVLSACQTGLGKEIREKAWSD